MQDIEAKEFLDLDLDLIIDARSPDEFIYSHIPKAENFYALNNAEHKEVGTIYKNESKCKASALGASYICKNASSHILKLQELITPGAKVGLYCARGGLRSKSLGIILEQLNYRIYRVKSGYKEYRNFVLSTLALPIKKNFITLYGNTGVGKTQILKELSPHIDLEGLASHQGSTFGAILGSQPTQKTFENKLVHILKSFVQDEVIFVEGESRRIGTISLPKTLYETMQNGVSVVVQSSMEKRVERIVGEYQNISQEYFYACMQKIKPYMAKTIHEKILQSYKEYNLNEVAYLLLENYYDKVYKKPKKVDYIVNSDDIQSATKNLYEIYTNCLKA